MSHIRRGLFGLLVVACAILGCADKNVSDDAADETAARSKAAALERQAILRGHHDRSVETFVKTEGFGGQRLGTMIRHSRPASYSLALSLPSGPADPSILPPGHPQPENPTPWMMEKVELVGLLNHETPRVLVFNSPSRPLDEFEKEALEELMTGEHVQVKESAGQVRMLGAIRARKDCKTCHNRPEGTLLGAFSYTLRPGVPKQEKQQKQQKQEAVAP